MALDSEMREIFEIFFEEACEGLTDAESTLLELTQGERDPERVHRLFRAIHSIKGGGGAFGFANLAGLSHAMETFLDRVREDAGALDARGQDLLLAGVDCLRGILLAHQDGHDVDAARCHALTADFEGLIDEGGAPREPAVERSEVLAPVPAEEAGTGWRFEFRPFDEFFRYGNDPLRLLQLVGELGELELTCAPVKWPEFAAYRPEQCLLQWSGVLTGAVERESIEEIFSWVIDEDCDFTLSALEHRDSRGSAPSAAESKMDPGNPKEDSGGRNGRETSASGQVKSNSIRVAVDKIDDLVNLTGELVITQSMLAQVERDHDLESNQDLRDGLVELERNTRELQETVMRIRMLPIGYTFSRFPRMVHDLGRQLGKEVDLAIAGQQTEIDKTVLEKIGDPLVHLVRNAVDHGIEDPAVREAAGKPACGTVSLRAMHQGGYILIEVEDDGRGVDRDRLLRKAKSKGLVEDGAPLSDEQVLSLLFHPGLSTAEVVSDVSGRGVGMDVVKRNIEALGGTISVSSEAGQGSCISIRLPLTLAIIDGQLVRVRDEIYIIPLTSIVESMQARSDRVTPVGRGREVYRFRDKALPLIRLDRTFGVPEGRGEPGTMFVVVDSDTRKVALAVDELLGIQQVVIKSLDTNYQGVPGLSGATILGDGKVALIVDIAGLIRLAQRALASPVLGQTSALAIR